MDVIVRYLRSSLAHQWLAQNCQRASKGFLRLQSRVLQRMPLPDDMVRAALGCGPTALAGVRERQMELALME